MKYSTPPQTSSLLSPGAVNSECRFVDCCERLLFRCQTSTACQNHIIVIKKNAAALIWTDDSTADPQAWRIQRFFKTNVQVQEVKKINCEKNRQTKKLQETL